MTRNRDNNTWENHKNISLNQNDDTEVHKFQFCGNDVHSHYSHLLEQVHMCDIYACLKGTG